MPYCWELMSACLKDSTHAAPQAALKALERWMETEGAAAGADPAALKSISAALAKRSATVTQLSVKPTAEQHSKRKRRIRRKKLPPEIAARCVGTVGDWCGEYFLQKPIPGKASLHAASQNT